MFNYKWPGVLFGHSGVVCCHSRVIGFYCKLRPLTLDPRAIKHDNSKSPSQWSIDIISWKVCYKPVLSGLRIPFDEGPPLRGEEEAAGQQDPADAKQKKLRQGEEVVVFYMTKNAALLMFNKIINKIFKYK